MDTRPHILGCFRIFCWRFSASSIMLKPLVSDCVPLTVLARVRSRRGWFCSGGNTLHSRKLKADCHFKIGECEKNGRSAVQCENNENFTKNANQKLKTVTNPFCWKFLIPRAQVSHDPFVFISTSTSEPSSEDELEQRDGNPRDFNTWNNKKTTLN